MESPVSSISGRRRNLSGAAVSDDIISASDYLQFRWPEGVEVGQFAPANVLDSGSETLTYERSTATLDLIKDSSTLVTEPELAAAVENSDGGVSSSANRSLLDAGHSVNLQPEAISTTDGSGRRSGKSGGDRVQTVTSIPPGHVAC
jgi:hypothetical protein